MFSSGKGFVGELANRRSETAGRIEELKGQLDDADGLSKGKASVYATGSFGRREASRHSDLDLFIVGKRDSIPGRDGKQGSLLKKLDEICIKADLIQAIRDLHIPPFSGDGQYLTHYCVDDLISTLGTPEDDVTNTFTARLLLILESFALLEPNVYDEVIGDVITAYWRDYEDHKRNFMPAFLANDILRLWRTFCVNYEARTEREPDLKKAKGKLKNYKLKHSRLLTCYSALLYLLTVYRAEQTVTPAAALEMITLAPTERLEWLLRRDDLAHAHGAITKLLDQYERFLESTNATEEELVQRLMDRNVAHHFIREASKFGDLVFEVLSTIGDGSPFYRLLVV